LAAPDDKVKAPLLPNVVDAPDPRVNDPLSPVFAAPDVTVNSPLLPDVLESPEPSVNAPESPLRALAPDPIFKSPLLPAVVPPAPVLNTNRPLTPVPPAFAVCRTMAPLLLTDEYPLINVT
jgi:hypothetical protein